jgi:phospholipid transport system transporter-binding protein
VIEFKNQELTVSGAINFENAETLYLNGLRIIQMQQQYPIIVNLSQLKAANSLTLAVLVRWLRQTPEAKGLLFKAVPEQMLKIIQSCHLENDLQMI